MSIHRYRYPTPQDAASACARHIFSSLDEVLAGNRPATLAISGGSTPKIMFGEMARHRFAWDRVHLFWVDERAVPPTHADSNYRMAEETFIVPAHFPRRNVHRIQTELQPDLAAQRYIEEIRQFFALEDGQLPHFDIIHRGIGADAHTASLFPGEPLIEDVEQIAASVFVEKLNSWRVTLLPGVLLNARHTVMLVCGADKADALRNIFDAPYEPLKYPAQVTAHHGRNTAWFLDEPAAAKMT